MAKAPYRDETPRLERRIEELEDELAGARAEIHALRGDTTEARAAPRATWLGLPLAQSMEVAIDGEVTDAAHEELLDRVRAWAGGSGHGASVGKAFRWSLDDPQAARSMEVSVRPEGGRTTIRIAERLGQLVANSVGGIVGGFGVSGVVGILMVAVLGRGQPVAVAIVVSAVWLALTFILARAVLLGLVSRRRRKHRELLHQLREVCERHVAAAARVRVDTDGADVKREALAESSADREAEREARAEGGVEPPPARVRR